MVLRGRELPGVVPVVPPRGERRPRDGANQATATPVVEGAQNHDRYNDGQRDGLFGTIKRKLVDWFSTLTLSSNGDRTSYENVAMEETLPLQPRPVASTPILRIGRRSLREKENFDPVLDSLEEEFQDAMEEPLSTINMIDSSAHGELKPTVATQSKQTGSPQCGLSDSMQLNRATYKPIPKTESATAPCDWPSKRATQSGLGMMSSPEETAPTVVNNYTNCSFGPEGNVARGHRPKIQIFDEAKIDIEAYIANFDAITKGWSDDDKLSALRQKLEGRAAKVLANLDLSGTLVTYRSLVDALEQHYIGERSVWMTHLRDVRRQEGESLDDLAFRISLYSKRAYGNLQPDLGIQFYLALRDTPLGDKLYAYKDRPLEEIIKHAKSYENHLLATNQPISDRPAPVTVAATNAGHETYGWSRGYSQLHANDYTRGRGRGRGGRGNNRNSRYDRNDRRLDTADKRCHICKNPDHLWKECPYVKRHMDATYSDEQSRSQAGPTSDQGNQ